MAATESLQAESTAAHFTAISLATNKYSYMQMTTYG